jgi:ADP-heptose:LPS heptosyltransferase
MRKAAIFNWLTYKLVRFERTAASTRRWRIGIYKVDRLGDFVLSLGAIHAIVDMEGEANCVIIHGAASAQIAAREFPTVARIELPPLDGKLWVTRNRLRRLIANEFKSGGVDQLLCLRHFRTLSDEVALQMIPASKVWCIQNSNLVQTSYELVGERFQGDVAVRRFSSRATPIDSCEDLECHRSLLLAWARERTPDLDLKPILDSKRASKEHTLLVAPFGSDRLRDLPIDSVAATIVHAKINLGLSGILLTPPDSIARYEAFAGELAKRGAVVELRVTHTLDELVATIDSGSALLTTETATAHIATALDRPMVCVIGGGHYGLFGPWRRSNRQIWITNRIPCFHCSWQCVLSEPACITGVSTDRIVRALGEVLNEVPTAAAKVNA